MNPLKLWFEFRADDKDVHSKMDGVVDKANSLSKKFGSFALGLGKVVAGGVTATAGAIALISKQSTGLFAEYEQLIGGTKLMFGEASDYVAQQAKNAYNTVQMSQNDYLRQVNGFATGLKTALGGNEQAAAELAHKIIKAEADVVAATGATQEMVQNAFTGIMRSNYVMLDNLQLGIKPSKEGFQELIDTVNEYNASIGKATNYQIDNLADAQSALIDYIDMVGMAGYASAEASETIQGSAMAMRASWQNLLSSMADETADMGELVNNFAQVFSKYAENMLPRFQQVFKTLPNLVTQLAPILGDLIMSLLPNLVQTASKLFIDLLGTIPDLVGLIFNMLPSIVSTLKEAIKTLFSQLGQYTTPVTDFIVSLSQGFITNAPIFVKNASKLINDFIDGFIEAIPNIISTGEEISSNFIRGFTNATTLIGENVPVIFSKLGEALKNNAPNLIENGLILVENLVDGIAIALPSIVKGGMELLGSLVQGLMDELPTLIEKVPTIVSKIANLINDNAPIILFEGAKIIVNIVKGILSAIPTLIQNIPQIIQAIVDVWSAFGWMNLGKNLIEGIKSGVDFVKKSLVDGVKNIGSSIKLWLDDIWNAIWTNTTSKWQAIKDAVWTPIKLAFDDVIRIVGNAKMYVDNIWQNMVTQTTTKWNAIKQAIMKPITDAKNYVADMIKKIKGLFDFEWSLPILKVPKVNVDGGEAPWGIGGKGRLPSFDVVWNAKGGILEQPTIFGFNPATGSFLGGGEAGKEAIAPIDELMNYVRGAVNESNGGMVEVLIKILNVLSDDDRLRNIFIEALLSGKFKIELDNREVGRVVRKYA